MPTLDSTPIYQQPYSYKNAVKEPEHFKKKIQNSLNHCENCGASGCMSLQMASNLMQTLNFKHNFHKEFQLFKKTIECAETFSDT